MQRFLFFVAILLFFNSCVVVREYDKVYLNDIEMQLGVKGAERFETNFQIYREASAGANGGKTGGGCGCN